MGIIFRNLLITFSALMLPLWALAQEQEISLFDVTGKPVAYIDMKDEMTIYLWDGYPVAYLSKNEKDYHVYGYNGKHLGWYENGIVYNHKGRIVGFSKDTNLMFTEPEPYKPIKKFAPTKLYQDIAPTKPYFYLKLSRISLYNFLKEGILP